VGEADTYALVVSVTVIVSVTAFARSLGACARTYIMRTSERDYFNRAGGILIPPNRS